MFPVKNLLCNQCLIGMKHTKDKIDPDYFKCNEANEREC